MMALFLISVAEDNGNVEVGLRWREKTDRTAIYFKVVVLLR